MLHSNRFFLGNRYLIGETRWGISKPESNDPGLDQLSSPGYSPWGRHRCLCVLPWPGWYSQLGSSVSTTYISECTNPSESTWRCQGQAASWRYGPTLSLLCLWSLALPFQTECPELPYTLTTINSQKTMSLPAFRQSKTQVLVASEREIFRLKRVMNTEVTS